MSRPNEVSNLGQFFDEINRHVREGGGQEKVARLVRDSLKAALAIEAFGLDCVKAALPAMGVWLQQGIDPVIVDDDCINCSIKLMMWPSGSVSSPHEHSCWTVTGVLYNSLSFSTFHLGLNQTLTLEREFNGIQGSVGYISKPCIHNVANKSGTGSLSLHVFSGPKGTPSGDADRVERGRTRWLESVDGHARRTKAIPKETAETLFGFLLSLRCQQANELIEQIGQGGDLSLKLLSIKALAKVNPLEAADRLLKLSKDCAEPDAKSLIAIAKAIQHNASGGD
jgi:hypothetical protein